MHTQPTKLDLADLADLFDTGRDEMHTAGLPDPIDLDDLDDLPLNHVPHLRLNEGSYLTLPTWSDQL